MPSWPSRSRTTTSARRWPSGSSGTNPAAARDQDVLQYVRAVGDDAVDPQIEQPIDLGCVVDRPHMNLLAQCVGTLDEAGGDDSDAPVRHRHLETDAFRSAPDSQQC